MTFSHKKSKIRPFWTTLLCMAQDQVQRNHRNHGIFGVGRDLKDHLTPTSWLNLVNPWPWILPLNSFQIYFSLTNIGFDQIIYKFHKQSISEQSKQKIKKGNLETLWVGRKRKWVWQHHLTLASCNHSSSGAGSEWGVRPEATRTHRVHLSGETLEFCLFLGCC